MSALPLKDTVVVELRVVACFLIVIYHCLCYAGGVWPMLPDGAKAFAYPFNMRAISTLGLILFVFISGKLYGEGKFRLGKYSDAGTFLRKKSTRLLVPYAIWGVGTYFAFHSCILPYSIIGGVAHLWFLLMLFDLFCLCTIFHKRWERTTKYEDLLVLLLGMITAAFLPMAIKNHLWLFSMNKALLYFPYFYMGMLLAKHQWLWTTRLSVTMILLLLPLCFISGAFAELESFWGMIERLLLLSSVYSLMVRIFSKRQLRNVWLSLDKNTMGIYILHHSFIWLLLYHSSFVRIYMREHVYVGACLMFFFVFPLSWGVSHALYRLKISKYLFG